MTNQNTQLPAGLTDEAVKESRQMHGSNYERKHDFSITKIVLSNVFSLFNIIMAGLIAMLFFVHENSTGQFIGIIACINTIIMLIQQIRARIIIKRLAKFSQTKITVIRNREKKIIPINDLVIGDVLYISQGDRIPVDGTVLRSDYAEFDESVLTGESHYVSKNNGDDVKAGSFLIAGDCYYIMQKLSKNSYLQTIVRHIVKDEFSESSIKTQIDNIVTNLTYITILFIIFILVEGILRQTHTHDIIINIAVIVSSLVPQGLLLITTISFAYGAMNIAKNQAIVQRLYSIESIADIKIICLDKTGTLTENKPRVKEILWK